jgi:hypothetical protein
MAVDVANLKPGDVLVMSADADLRNQTGAWLIQLGAAMKEHPWQPWKWGKKDKPYYNHVALYTHTDAEGHHRGLEGRPSAFGWANCDRYIQDPNTVSNTGQAKTDQQRADLVAFAVRMIGIPYDWASIVSFAAEAAGFKFRAKEWPADGLPSQVVCSTSIDYAYEAVGLDNPGGYTETRGTDPTDWARWIETNGYG